METCWLSRVRRIFRRVWALERCAPADGPRGAHPSTPTPPPPPPPAPMRPVETLERVPAPPPRACRQPLQVFVVDRYSLAVRKQTREDAGSGSGVCAVCAVSSPSLGRGGRGRQNNLPSYRYAASILGRRPGRARRAACFCLASAKSGSSLSSRRPGDRWREEAPAALGRAGTRGRGRAGAGEGRGDEAAAALGRDEGTRGRGCCRTFRRRKQLWSLSLRGRDRRGRDRTVQLCKRLVHGHTVPPPVPGTGVCPH